MGAFGCFRTDAELAPSPAEVRPLILTRVKQDPKPGPAAEIRRAAFVRKLLLGHVVREPMHAAILEWKAKTKSEIRQSGYVLAGMCYFIFFFHYCVATCLSSFFADYATDRNVSNSVVALHGKVTTVWLLSPPSGSASRKLMMSHFLSLALTRA